VKNQEAGDRRQVVAHRSKNGEKTPPCAPCTPCEIFKEAGDRMQEIGDRRQVVAQRRKKVKTFLCLLSAKFCTLEQNTVYWVQY